MKKVMLVFGTRPEAIKMCPLVKELKQHTTIETVVCVTGQHKEMLEQVLDVFKIIPDYDLGVMKTNQTLFTITTSILDKIWLGMRLYKLSNIGIICLDSSLIKGTKK